MASSRPTAGDDGRYDQFFDECLLPALRLARRLTGNASLAEDIAVEALGRAYAHWDRVSQMAHGRAWVMRVTTNLVIGQARKGKVPVPPGPAQSDLADVVALRLALLDTMATLPRPSTPSGGPALPGRPARARGGGRHGCDGRIGEEAPQSGPGRPAGCSRSRDGARRWL